MRFSRQKHPSKVGKKVSHKKELRNLKWSGLVQLASLLFGQIKSDQKTRLKGICVVMIKQEASSDNDKDNDDSKSQSDNDK